MKKPTTPEDARNRRIAPRIEATGMRVAIKSEGLFSRKLVDCHVLDISHGGIGISSDTLKLRHLQIVKMHLACQGRKFYAQGVVSYFHPCDRVTQYGIIFVNAPRELDQLINSLMGLPDDIKPAPIEHGPANTAPQPVDVTPGTQRRLEPRFHTARLGLGIRHTGWRRFGANETCTLQDISRGGVSFLCTNPSLKVMHPAELEITHGRHSYHARAIVCHSHIVNDRYVYGAEFTHISPALVRMIEELSVDATPC